MSSLTKLPIGLLVARAAERTKVVHDCKGIRIKIGKEHKESKEYVKPTYKEIKYIKKHL